MNMQQDNEMKEKEEEELLHNISEIVEVLPMSEKVRIYIYLLNFYFS